MRIVAGKFGSLQIVSPKGHRTHPMSEKIRGAIFNALGDVSGKICLDAYAGSGALGLEFISRGGNNVVLIDIDRSAHQTIVENITKLGIGDQCKAVRANVASWSQNNTSTKFDIVFADPPYDKVNQDTLRKLFLHVSNDGMCILSLPPSLKPPEVSGFKNVSTKDYGDSKIVFYAKN